MKRPPHVAGPVGERRVCGHGEVREFPFADAPVTEIAVMKCARCLHTYLEIRRNDKSRHRETRS